MLQVESDSVADILSTSPQSNVSTATGAENHTNESVNEKHFCRDCQISFENVKEFSIHYCSEAHVLKKLMAHHKMEACDEDTKYCRICNKHITNKHAGKTHYISSQHLMKAVVFVADIKPNNVPAYCSVCDVKLRKSSAVQYHYSSTLHQILMFLSSPTLPAEVWMDSEVLRYCSKCDEQFSNVVSACQHYCSNLHTTNAMSEICSVCNIKVDGKIYDSHKMGNKHQVLVQKRKQVLDTSDSGESQPFAIAQLKALMTPPPEFTTSRWNHVPISLHHIVCNKMMMTKSCVICYKTARNISDVHFHLVGISHYREMNKFCDLIREVFGIDVMDCNNMLPHIKEILKQHEYLQTEPVDSNRDNEEPNPKRIKIETVKQ